MTEVWGVLAAVVSSVLGGTSIGTTRFLVNAIDPLAIGSFRFGVGFVLLLPVALVQGHRWPPRHDWPAVAGLGLLFYTAFPILFNASLIFTTAARGALALSTLPLLTMVVGTAFGSEPLTARKTAGVLVAISGVPMALLSGLTTAPDGAWRGDLLMVSAALCMALYSIWSKPFIRRSGPIPFTTLAMAAGPAVLVILSMLHGSFAPVEAFGPPQWLSALYLGAFGSALTFYLWAFALERTTPTRVAISVTRQSGRGLAGRRNIAGRAAALGSRGRDRDGVHRYLDRDDPITPEDSRRDRSRIAGAARQIVIRDPPGTERKACATPPRVVHCFESPAYTPTNIDSRGVEP